MNVELKEMLQDHEFNTNNVKNLTKINRNQRTRNRGIKDIFLRPADFCMLLLDYCFSILKMVVSTELSTCEERQQMFVKMLHFGQCSQACVGLLGCPVKGQELDCTSKRLLSGTKNVRLHFCPF